MKSSGKIEEVIIPTEKRVKLDISYSEAQIIRDLVGKCNGYIPEISSLYKILSTDLGILNSGKMRGIPIIQGVKSDWHQKG